MSTEATIERGRRARTILEDDLIKEAFLTLRRHLTDEWRGTALGQSAAREALFHVHCGLEEFERHFRSLIETGKVAEARLEEQKREAAAEAGDGNE